MSNPNIQNDIDRINNIVPAAVENASESERLGMISVLMGHAAAVLCMEYGPDETAWNLVCVATWKMFEAEMLRMAKREAKKQAEKN